MRSAYQWIGTVAITFLSGILSLGTAFGQIPIEFAWRPAPNISPGRYYHTATVLADERVLVTGGRRGFEPLQSVRVFDPKANGGMGEWTILPDMIDRRERHQATLMPAGWVLITGGLDGVPIRGCELIDPIVNQHQQLPSMNDVRYEHTATCLPNGKVLVVGSKDYDRGLPSCEIFESLQTAQASDPIWRWRRTGSLTFGRGKHRAVLLQDGRVLVIGGVHNYLPTATCEAFDPASETWRQVAPMRYAREGHTATLLPDGRVLVTGGDIGGSEISTCEVFDPYKYNGFGEWQRVESTNFGRKNHTATLINSRFLILTGAWRTGQGDRSVEIMDTWLPNARWHLGPQMLTDRSNHSATLLADGRLLLIGGELLGYQDATTACDVSEKTLDVAALSQPSGLSISSIWPNPFSSSTNVAFFRNPAESVILAIYDVLGREVRRYELPGTAEGRLEIRWDGLDDHGRSLPGGMYQAVIIQGSSRSAATIRLLR